MRFRPKNINILEWIAIVPKIIGLVDDVIVMLRDGKVTKEEIDKIGSDLVAIVTAVA